MATKLCHEITDDDGDHDDAAAAAAADDDDDTFIEVKGQQGSNKLNYVL